MYTIVLLAVVFTIESAVLGCVATLLGFAAGALLAPRLAGPMAEATLATPTVAADPAHLVVAAVPLGIALYVAVYRVAGGEGNPSIAPWWSLALVPLGTVLLVVVATSLPARLATRAPAVEALGFE